jgi:diacylglycerol kinase (ATP)
LDTLFIVNPVAGRGKSLHTWARIKSKISFSYEFVLTGAPGEARQAAAKALSEGFGRVIAVGGDGTVSEVVNGIAKGDAVLGIIPTGTGNDFVKSLGISLNPIEALSLLDKGYSQAIDLGMYVGGYYINVAGAGLDAEVVKMTNERLRFLGGAPAYAVSLLATIGRFLPREAIIDIDGRQIRRTVWLISAANGRYYGGGMKICPEARLDDGLLDICIINETSRPELIRFFPTVFTGRHTKHPSFELIRGKSVKIAFSKPCSVQVDGEVIGTTPLEISVIPSGIRVIKNKQFRFSK